MLVTVTEFDSLNLVDDDGHRMPMAKTAIARHGITADGPVGPLSDGTKFVRIATNTDVQISDSGAVDGDSDLFPAGAVEYRGVEGGTTLTFAAVA